MVHEKIRIEIHGPIEKLDFEINSEPVEAYWYGLKFINNKKDTVYLMVEKESIFSPTNYQAFINDNDKKLPITGRWDRSPDQIISKKGNSEKEFKFFLWEIPDVDTISYLFEYSFDSTLAKREIIKVDCVVKDNWKLHSFKSNIMGD